METIGALPSITAKVLAICDALLSVFVSITTTSGIGDCTINIVNANLTACGGALVGELGDLVYYLVLLGSGMLPALGAV